MYKLPVLLIVMILFMGNLMAQNSRGEPSDSLQVKKPKTVDRQDSNEATVFEFVEEMPEFPGGEAAMFKFIIDHVDYPDSALEMGIQQKVYVNFVVDESGKIIHVSVGNKVHPLLAAEAIRVIRSMPDWKPGKSKGKPVKVRCTLPIQFRLE